MYRTFNKILPVQQKNFFKENRPVVLVSPPKRIPLLPPAGRKNG